MELISTIVRLCLSLPYLQWIPFFKIYLRHVLQVVHAIFPNAVCRHGSQPSDSFIVAPKQEPPQAKQVQTWWKGIWNFIKKTFGKVNSNEYLRAAHNIMNQRLNELRLVPTEVVSEESSSMVSTTFRRIV